MSWLHFTNAKYFGSLYLNDAQPLLIGLKDGAATFIGFGVGFYFKLFFVLFLIFVHIYLVISQNIEEETTKNKLKFLQSGNGGKDHKKWAIIIGGVLSNLAAAIAIKNEIKEQNLSSLKAEQDRIIKKTAENLEELVKLKEEFTERKLKLSRLLGEEVKHTAHYLRLQELSDKLSDDIADYKKLKKQVSSDDTAVSDLIRSCENLKKNISRYGEEIHSLDEEEAGSSTDKARILEKPASDSNDDSEIHKSSIFNFDYSIEWFEGLGGIQKLAVGILLGKTAILSALISILFIFYGDFLLDKFEIGKKHPLLGKIISLRKRFKNFYFKYNCLLIVIVVMSEIVLSLALLEFTLI